MTRRKDNGSATQATNVAASRYGVVGNPVAHSKSPEIHQLFARQTQHPISYERLEAPIDGFEEFALALRDAGYLGLNVTIPFKIDAAKLADDLTPRARLASAVNTLKFAGRAAACAASSARCSTHVRGGLPWPTGRSDGPRNSQTNSASRQFILTRCRLSISTW
jgi:hypothetical protein